MRHATKTLVLQTREHNGERATLALGVRPVLARVAADPDGRWGFHVVIRRLRSQRAGFENTHHPSAWPEAEEA